MQELVKCYTWVYVHVHVCLCSGRRYFRERETVCERELYVCVCERDVCVFVMYVCVYDVCMYVYVWCVHMLHVFPCVYKHACGGQRTALDVGLYLPYILFETVSLCCLALPAPAQLGSEFQSCSCLYLAPLRNAGIADRCYFSWSVCILGI